MKKCLEIISFYRSLLKIFDKIPQQVKLIKPIRSFHAIIAELNNIKLIPIANSFQNVAKLGPTWEFQLSLKSCNIASWTTKWYDYGTGTDKQWQSPI